MQRILSFLLLVTVIVSNVISKEAAAEFEKVKY